MCYERFLVQPTLPQSHLSRDETTTFTHDPRYSHNPEDLREMLEDQSKYPPSFAVRFIGTHTETVKKKDKKESVTVTDFDVRIDMTHLLVPGPSTPSNLIMHGFDVSESHVRTYRGFRTKSTCPQEDAPDIESYILSYTTSPFRVRSFTLNRRITNHDSRALEGLIASLVRSTNYRGHLKITFPMTHNRVTVYSPCWQNQYRQKWWIRWFFYLTFLWMLSWPYLWFVTRRWEVATAVFPYSSWQDDGSRKFVTKSEQDFFEEWKSSIKRAVLGKQQGWIDEVYKLATDEASMPAEPIQIDRLPNTGNVAVDGALGFLQHAVIAGRGGSLAGGWGADS